MVYITAISLHIPKMENMDFSTEKGLMGSSHKNSFIPYKTNCLHRLIFSELSDYAI